MTCARPAIFARPIAAFAGLLLSAAPAAALTITPYFDASITTSGNAASVESAINQAISTVDSLYSNTGTVGIVFSQSSSVLGQSETVDYSIGYSGYVAALTADATAHPSNTILATALAHLSAGNDANGAGAIDATSAFFRAALGFNATGCFNSAGAFVNTCGQSYDGVITLGTGLNYGTTPVANTYSAIATAEHEIDEILGGGGQGSTLGQIIAAFGPLDLYRYSAAATPSFTTSGSATAYFSVDGGTTSIVSFNQTAPGDYADFGASGDVQSAYGTPGTVPSYTTASPEFAMMSAIGYDAVAVPEPGSLAVFALAALAMPRTRRRRR